METLSRETHIKFRNPWYITGIVEGEGTFTYSHSGNHLALYFAVKLTATDRRVLESIQKFFGGIGKIYMVKPSYGRKNSGRTKTSCYYRVTRISELPYIVSHFERFPFVGNKRKSFAIWREMVRLKLRMRRAPINTLNMLAEKLSAAAVRNQT